MDASEYTDVYRQIKLQITRHRVWNAALRSLTGGSGSPKSSSAR